MTEVNRIELICDAINCPVVQVAGRSFPGVVIQGDSLKNLHDIVERVSLELKAQGNEDLHDTAEWAREILVGYLVVYQDSLKERGIPLPYNEEVRALDDERGED